jgi:UTP--glucose-1-phosphate uridylyltransferase
VDETLAYHNPYYFSGMVGAKSALEVKDNMTFLDLAVQQIKHLNSTEHVDVPLLLMTSFNTQEDTIRIVKKYANQHQVRITTFNQSRYPKIYNDTLLLVPKSIDDDRKAWYPPGHGDLYLALHRSGVLDQLLTEGKEYLFVSNSDNLGAVLVLTSTIMFTSMTMYLLPSVLIRRYYDTWLRLKPNFLLK